MEAAADAGSNNALERFFKFKQWNTSLKRDTLAGLTTFIVMSYIIFVNPSILGLEGKGLPFAAALTSTCLVAGVMTIIMGLFTNRAYACLLYTSDAADEEDSVDLGGRRIIKKKKKNKNNKKNLR